MCIRDRGDDCGYRPGHPMISWIKGRVDDMVKIRGISLYPVAIEKIVMSDYRFGSNYQIVLEGYDDIVVVTEAAKEASAEERRALAEELEQKIHSEIGLRVRAEVLPPGGMPPSEGKAKRLVDRRKV